MGPGSDRRRSSALKKKIRNGAARAITTKGETADAMDAGTADRAYVEQLQWVPGGRKAPIQRPSKKYVKDHPCRAKGIKKHPANLTRKINTRAAASWQNAS